MVEMLRQGITARQILTREAFENAIAVVMALGGSTNAVLHLLAIAREAEVPLGIDDFNTIGEKVLAMPPEPRVDKGVPFRDIPS